MAKLRNHPVILVLLILKIRFEHFEETVILNGDYCFQENLMEGIVLGKAG